MQLVYVKATNWLWIIWLISTLTTAVDQSQDCDCGFVNENGLFTDYWYTDFSSYQGDIKRDPSFFVGNYSIEAKYAGTYPRSFRSDNVLVSSNSLQLFVSVNGTVQCASVGTKRSVYCHIVCSDEPTVIARFPNHDLLLDKICFMEALEHG
jgi:hypothetical protein